MMRAARRVVLVLVAGAGSALLAGVGQARAGLPSNCEQSAITVSCTFSFTGAPDQTFKVPAGVSSVDIVAVGAPGGDSGPREPSPVPGGGGAVASGAVEVSSGQVLYVEVGGPGDAGFFTSAGGFNGGGMGDPRRSSGPSGPGAGGGGGASDVRTAPYSAGLSADPRLVVAGGGGGAGAPTPRGPTLPGYYLGGPGGGAGWPGREGWEVCSEDNAAAGGGGPGTGTSGGSGGRGGTGTCEGGETPGQKGGDGALGQGGGGSTVIGVGGGGGGGGLYGGGQGGQGVFVPKYGLFGGTGGGGGGGSSLVPAGGSVAPNPAGLPPSVTISYTLAGQCLGRRATIVARAGGGLTRGTPRNDVIVGSKGTDRIVSGGGNDLVCSRGDADRVSTGAGADRVLAGHGDDRVRTGSGDDRIGLAAGGRDLLHCGPGHDHVHHGPADRLRACESATRTRSPQTPPAGGATVFVHSAAGGELRGGRLILRGVGRRVTWAHHSGRSGVMAVKPMQRLLFKPGTGAATGTLHVAGHRGGDEPTFKLTKPRYNAARHAVSYKVMPLGDGRLPGRTARAAGNPARGSFGAASLSIVATAAPHFTAHVYSCPVNGAPNSCLGITGSGLDPGAVVVLTTLGGLNEAVLADRNGEVDWQSQGCPPGPVTIRWDDSNHRTAYTFIAYSCGPPH
jgi:hypothetical protein